MRSKAEIIRDSLSGAKVLDLGGAGWGDNNKYEEEIRAAWYHCANRVVVDRCRCDVRMDLNNVDCSLDEYSDFHFTTAFDVLEHLDCPVALLKAVPTKKLIVTLPNGISPFARFLEIFHRSDHIYSFTPYTAGRLLHRAGWIVVSREYIMGKWCRGLRILNFLFSIAPRFFATGIAFQCERPG